jgi:hypothetical protein
MYTEPRKTIQY